jgi:hypothetical protein
MQHLFSISASSRSNNCRQAYVLLLLGVAFLIIAWLGMFNSSALGVGFGLFVLGLVSLATSRVTAQE